MKYIIQNEDAKAITEWYQKNKRQLPWRDTNNPYDVWLSEIMLQQTRIEAVKPKFLLFKQTLPTIQDLANCEEDALMRLWEGLGYYSRARNLKKCAIALVEQYNAQLPEDYKALLKLPGIGPYTAGAISSIAYGLPAAAVDGNVMRVLARYFEITEDIRSDTLKKEMEQTILECFQEDSTPSFVSNFNQGIMELGETICIPNGEAKCSICPLQHTCKAHLHETTDTIPYRSALNQRKIIERTLFIIRDGDQFLIHKRADKGLLAGLYEFIGVDAHLNKKEVIQEVEKHNIHPTHIKRLEDAKHIFTHLEWHMHAYEITVEQIEHLQQKDYLLLNKQELQTKAIPSAFKKYISYYTIRE